MSAPLKLYGTAGPSANSVRLILDELNIKYEAIEMAGKDAKSPEYVAKINPNGRIPALEDPNTGVTLWESGAIIEYLVEKYDTTNALSFPQGSPEFWAAKQYLFFQVTGQGPYFEQAVWFSTFHHERLPSASEKFTKEINRVCGVLEEILKRQEATNGSAWLVGSKCSFVDISFVMWQKVVEAYLGEAVGYLYEAYPKFAAWMAKLAAREKVAARVTAITEEIKAHDKPM